MSIIAVARVEKENVKKDDYFCDSSHSFIGSRKYMPQPSSLVIAGHLLDIGTCSYFSFFSN
jgi:hypothetical protein